MVTRKRDALSSTNNLIRLLCDQVRVMRGKKARHFPWSGVVMIGNRARFIEKKLSNIRELWRGRRQLQRYREAA